MMIRAIVWLVMGYLNYVKRDLAATRSDRQSDEHLLTVAAMMFILGITLWILAL